MASILTNFRDALKALWPRLGGAGYGSLRLLLPGTQHDYASEAGDLWNNSIVALGIAWLGKRFTRPLISVSRIMRNGDYRPVGRHALTDLWARPNAHYGRRTLESAVGLSLVCDGNAYIQIIRDGAGRPVELWWLNHARVAPTWPADGSAFLTGYKIQLDTGWYSLDVADVIHVRDGIDPNNERLGLSAVKAQVREICTVNQESGYTASLLRNSGVPGLAVVPDADGLHPNADDAQTIRRRFHETAGGDEVGSTVVLAGKYKIQQIGFSPEQLRLESLPDRAISRIAAAVGVAPMSMGLADPGKTYSNLAEANKTSWGTVVAVQELIGEALRWQLLPQLGDDPRQLIVEYDYSQVQELQEALDAIHLRTREDWKAGLLQLNEAREALGYDVDPDGDRYFPGTGSPEEQVVQDQRHQERLAVLQQGNKPGLPQPDELTQQGNKPVLPQPDELTPVDGGGNGNGDGQPAEGQKTLWSRY